MCSDCFEQEIPSFPTENSWLEFDLELTKKLGSSKMQKTDFKPDGKRDKDDGEYIYKCNSCGQVWRLKDPDYSFRGYFLRK